MVPVGRLIVLRTTPKEKLTQAIAYITWPALSALVIGPPLGGFITTYASWHWIFFLNLPIGIIALMLALLWIENVRGTDVHPFDWLTFVLGGFASTGTVYAIEELGGEGGHWLIPASILTLSLLSGVIARRCCMDRFSAEFSSDPDGLRGNVETANGVRPSRVQHAVEDGHADRRFSLLILEMSNS